MRLMKRLPKEDYDKMVAACDVGMIFLDHRFTIPNFPSRLLAYMQAGIPVLACTDPNTDIGKVIVDGGFGWWCESNSVAGFHSCIENAINETELSAMKQKELDYLSDNYTVEKAYKIIIRQKN
jgi:glycosyltransferase involved in cell wall biosynthesis